MSAADRTPASFRPCRSLLFVPGDRPDRFPKALASAADLVAFDLEDAVAPGPAKAAAREAVAAELRRLDSIGGQSARIGVRINSPRTADGIGDLLALAAAPLPRLVIVPKVEGPDELATAAAHLAAGPESAVAFIPSIESAEGLEDLAAIARGLPAGRVVALLFGAMDYSAQIGCTLDWEPLLYARSRLVHCARLVGAFAIDSPHPDAADLDAVEAEASRVRRLGFDGKAAIHPAQLAPIHRGFAPDPTELARARRVVEAFEHLQGGVALLDGRLLERPVYLAARRMLGRATAPDGPLLGL